MKKLILFFAVMCIGCLALNAQIIVDFESGTLPGEVSNVLMANTADASDVYDGIVDNPFKDLINSSEKVAKVTLSAGADRKSFTSLKFVFATPVDFSGTDKTISAKVYKEAANGDVTLRLLKAPGGTGAAFSHSTTHDVSTGSWQTIEWDLSGTALDGKSSGSVLFWPDNMGDGVTVRSNEVVFYIDDVKVPGDMATSIKESALGEVNALVTENEVVIIGTESVDELTIYDISGKQIYQGRELNRVNISDFKKGVYVLSLSKRGQSKVLKFAK